MGCYSKFQPARLLKKFLYTVHALHTSVLFQHKNAEDFFENSLRILENILRLELSFKI